MPSETPARHASYSDSFLSGLLLIISSALRRRCGGEQYLPSWKTLAAHQLFLLILFDLRKSDPTPLSAGECPILAVSTRTVTVANLARASAVKRSGRDWRWDGDRHATDHETRQQCQCH